jgi:hypothetical protein
MNGRMMAVIVDVVENGVTTPTVVYRPVKWLRQAQRDARRQRSRSGPKVVRADTDSPPDLGAQIDAQAAASCREFE